jgi:hypothetical protein
VGVLDALRADIQRQQFNVSADLFDPEHDWDYGMDSRTDDRLSSGGQNDEFDLRLMRDEKWRKLGLQASRYGPDLSWLDRGPKGWSIVFHGTSAADGILSSILNNGLRTAHGSQIVHGNVYGNGVYCSPSLAKAKHYCKPLQNGKNVVFFCRVRPSGLQKKTGDIWLVPNDADIRLVGMLVGPYP